MKEIGSALSARERRLLRKICAGTAWDEIECVATLKTILLEREGEDETTWSKIDRKIWREIEEIPESWINEIRWHFGLPVKG